MKKSLPHQDEVREVILQYASDYTEFANIKRGEKGPGYIIQEFKSIGSFRQFIRRLGKYQMRGCIRWTTDIQKELHEYSDFDEYFKRCNRDNSVMIVLSIDTPGNTIFLPIPIEN